MGQGQESRGDEGFQYGMAKTVQGQAQRQRLNMDFRHLSQYILCCQQPDRTGIQNTECCYMAEDKSTGKHFMPLLHLLYRVRYMGKEMPESPSQVQLRAYEAVER